MYKYILFLSMCLCLCALVCLAMTYIRLPDHHPWIFIFGLHDLFCVLYASLLCMAQFVLSRAYIIYDIIIFIACYGAYALYCTEIKIEREIESERRGQEGSNSFISHKCPTKTMLTTS